MSAVFLNNEALRLVARMAGDKSLTAGGLAEGTNANTYKTANTVTFLINGAFKSKAATDNVAFTAGHAAINPGADTAQRCKFLVSLSAAGVFKTTQGTIVAAADTAVAPKVPVGEAPVGTIEVETDASTTFTPATTDLGAAGITDTYVDLAWPDDGGDSLIYA